MAREYAVYVTGPDGGSVAILPDQEIPDWAVKQLDKRHLDATSSGAADDGPPPQSGKGSGKDAWIAYAEANGVDVAEDATKDDIIDACAAAGVATE